MSRKRHSVDQIIGKLRQADVDLGQGKTVEEACRGLESTVQTYYRWRQKYGGMQPGWGDWGSVSEPGSCDESSAGVRIR
jgi:hypothetical protein